MLRQVSKEILPEKILPSSTSSYSVTTGDQVYAQKGAHSNNIIKLLLFIHYLTLNIKTENKQQTVDRDLYRNLDK
jgi:hypothetical protein